MILSFFDDKWIQLLGELSLRASESNMIEGQVNRLTWVEGLCGLAVRDQDK
jgi:hypothetical protein